MKKKMGLMIFLTLACFSLGACGMGADNNSTSQGDISVSEESFASEISESSETSESVEQESSETSESVEQESTETSESVEQESSETSESVEQESSETSESVEQESSETSESVEEEVYYMVAFDTDGGNTIASIMVLSGEKVEKPQNPNKLTDYAEYEFLYWQYNGEEWDFENDVVTENMTLVAEWKMVDLYTPPFLPNN